MAFPKKVAIIGLGLIGGSLGQALLKKMPKTEVIGIPRRKVTIELAKKKKAITRGTLDLAAVKDADLIIIATPIDRIVPTFKHIIPYLKKGALVTDVASTKREIVSAIESMCPPAVDFVGGHPMAGKEHAGIEHADASILKGATFVVTETRSTAKAAIKKLSVFAAKLGMKPLCLKPAVHDLVVAAVSHLPFIVATSLAGTARSMTEHRELIARIAAGGFRDTTRVASSSPQWGRDVVGTNREQLIEVLDLFEEQLQEIRALIDRRDLAPLERLFARTKDYRDELYPVKK